MEPGIRQKEHTDFSMEEAKASFENQILRTMPMASRAKKTSRRQRFAAPGDFTPLWEKAVASAGKKLECYDVPIENEIRYKAIQSEYRNGKATAVAVNVYQKLVVVKNRKSGKMTSYILTLIPDKDYEKKYKHQVEDRFINCADKGDFSGTVFYSVPNLNIILCVSRYKKERKCRAYFL